VTAGNSVQWIGYGMNDHSSISGRGGEGIFFSATEFRPALGPTQPPIQCVQVGKTV
jgi:hypothetical protein